MNRAQLAPCRPSIRRFPINLFFICNVCWLCPLSVFTVRVGHGKGVGLARHVVAGVHDVVLIGSDGVLGGFVSIGTLWPSVGWSVVRPSATQEFVCANLLLRVCYLKE